MSDSDRELDNVPIDDLIDELLLRFDAEFREGRSPDWSWYLAHCPDTTAKAELLSLMIRSEQGHSDWDPGRVTNRMRLYPETGLKDDWTLTLVRKLYADRIESGELPSLDEFEPLGLPVDQLQLRTEDDELFLGYAVGNRYWLEQRIGEGSCGTVYRATDSIDGCKVAVKVARGIDDNRKAQARRLLEQESAALKVLPHAGIPRLLDLASEGGTLCMVMEFVDGQTLHQLRRQGPLTPERAAKIVAQLAETLQFAHRRGYLHRDLSPANVLVDKSDVPFLMDFGLADLQADLFDRDRDGVGTPGYRSRESLIGATREIDARDDIWSLGVILYELLTGHPAPASRSMASSYESALNFEKQLSDLGSNVPPTLRVICQRCVADDPDDRYDIAGLLARELRSFLGEKLRPVNEARLELAKRRLLAWRAGLHCASAYRCHTWARWRLDATIKESNGNFEDGGVPFGLVLESEKDCLDEFLKCTLLATKLGIPLAKMANISEFAWVYNNRGDRPDLNVCTLLSAFMDGVDRTLGEALGQLPSHLDEGGDETRAVLRLAILCGSRAVGPSLPDEVKCFTATAKFPHDCTARFIACVTGEKTSEEHETECDRLNKSVERELMHQLADELDGPKSPSTS